MAVSINIEPQDLTPANNQMLFSAFSSFQSEDSFLLVSEIYVNGDLQTKLKVPVNPNGRISFDIHKHIQNKTTFDFNPTWKGWNAHRNSLVEYQLKIYEEYRPIWRFESNYDEGGNLAFRSPDPIPFIVGDDIVVIQDTPFTQPSYNGIARIINITQVPSGQFIGQNVIVTNKPFVGITPPEGGEIRYSGFQVRTTPVNVTTPVKYAFNGVRNFVDFINWDALEYSANPNNPAKFLTDVPNGYRIKENARMWLATFTEVGSSNHFYLQVTTANGVYQLTNDTPATSENALSSVGVGTWNLSGTDTELSAQGWVEVQGTFPIIDSSINSYTVEILNEAGVQTVRPITFNIDRRCSRYEDVQLVFLDKLGSFVPFTFNMVNIHSKTISRTTYQRDYMPYAQRASGRYDSWDRGITNLNTVVTDTYTVNSNWITQNEADYLMQLLESPQVYWVKTDGTTVAINITDTTITRPQSINTQVINITLSFEESVKNNSQIV